MALELQPLYRGDMRSYLWSVSTSHLYMATYLCILNLSMLQCPFPFNTLEWADSNKTASYLGPENWNLWATDRTDLTASSAG